MNSKEYLGQAYRLNELIDSEIKELDELTSRRLSMESPKLDAIGKGSGVGAGAKYTYIIDKIIDLEEKINSEIDRYIDLKEELRTAINQVEDAEMRVLLIDRYLNFMTWTEIAVKMNYSERHIYRIHKQALRLIKTKTP